MNKMQKLRPKSSRKQLRADVIARALAASPEEHKRENLQAQERMERFLQSQSPSTLGVFLAMPHEVDCSPAYLRLLERGWNLYLPICIRLSEEEAEQIEGFGPGTPWMRWAPLRAEDLLEARVWKPGAAVPGSWKVRYGTLLERPLEEALPVGVVPQWVQVPALAYRPSGYRLGHGGGYYDRLLAWAEKNRPDLCSFAVPASWQLGWTFDLEPWDRPVQHCLLHSESERKLC